MEDLLVGSTGFVGGNMMRRHAFEAACHSADVMDYYGSRPGLCVYAGVPAAMYIANADPEADLRIMERARENLRRISPRKAVLVSTIAVYGSVKGAGEAYAPDKGSLAAYGLDRLLLEEWVREDFPGALVLRLPALYGTGLKKNFLFDLHTVAPAMLREDRYIELSKESSLVGQSYVKGSAGFYSMKGNADRGALRKFFAGNGFNAISFTDSRSRYQFYGLDRLWPDIRLALENGLETLNLATPPVAASEVYEAVTGRRGWANELDREPFDYDMRTDHWEIFGGMGGYIMSVDEEMDGICRFMREWEEQEGIAV